MPDEASSMYTTVIDQLIEGQQWLKENLNLTPENSWSIDPFGHSGTMPYLWSKAGMKRMVIQRIHQATKGKLIREGSLEFYWKQYWDQSTGNDILCHVMPYILYSLHQTCGPDKFTCALFDFKNVPEEPRGRMIYPIDDENIQKKARLLYEQYRLKSSIYKHNSILVPLGDDFRYNYEKEWDQQYENYKKLMKYMNAKKEWKINVTFGTLRDFFQDIDKSEMIGSVKFKSLSGDFFPYSDFNKAYWTGFYTTRPFDKRFARETEARLRAAEILNVLAVSYSQVWKQVYLDMPNVKRKLELARRNLGLFLHHDAITGTSKPEVVQDYEDKLLEAFTAAGEVMAMASQFVLSKGKLQSNPILQTELVRDDPRVPSMHQPLEPTKEGVRLVLVNPTGQLRSEFMELMVTSVDIEIKNSKRKNVPFQITPIFSSSSEVSTSPFEIVFPVEITAFGVETFIISKIHRSPNSFWSKITIYNTDEIIVPPDLKFEQERPRRAGGQFAYFNIENSHLSAEFTSSTGFLHKILDKKSNISARMILQFKHYISRGSGAYIFFPNGPAKDVLQRTPIVRVLEGPYMTEVQTVYYNLFHKVRLYHHLGLQGKSLHLSNALDMQALNMRDKEVIMRFSTNLNNKPGSLFTDQNGFQIIGRKSHPTDTKKAMNIERNYYPITTMAFIQDQNVRITLHTAQPHGGASLEKGWLEVMLDRQLLYDDERGLGDGVTDNKLTMTKFVLQVEHSESVLDEKYYSYPSMLSMVTNEFLQQPIQKLFSPVNSDILSLNFIPLQHSLPCDISVVNLRSLYKADGSYKGIGLTIHRKGFKCEFPSDGALCSGTNVNIRDLFPELETHEISETLLNYLFPRKRMPDLANLYIPSMELKSYFLDLSPYGSL